LAVWIAALLQERATPLGYSSGTTAPLRNEYRVPENRLLGKQIKGRIQLSDGKRQTLTEIGQKLGKQALEKVASLIKPALPKKSILD
jgi:hypothetical protein